MTHYMKDYKTIPEGPARDLAAIQDAWEYIGDAKRFNLIVRGLSPIDDLEDAEVGLSFAGIQGLPARALFRLSRGYKEPS